jgi:hypothetical protein
MRFGLKTLDNDSVHDSSIVGGRLDFTQGTESP